MKVEGNMLGSRMMGVGMFRIHCIHEWNCHPMAGGGGGALKKVQSR